MMQKTRLIVGILLAVLAAVLMFQNREPVETKLLFFTITMSRSVTLLTAVLLGFLAGIAFTLFGVQKRKLRLSED